MDLKDISSRPQIEDPQGPIFEQQVEAKKAQPKAARPFESKAGLAALGMALFCVMAVLGAGRDGNKAYFRMQAGFDARLTEQSTRSQMLMLENRIDIQQALKKKPSDADLQARVDLRKKADDSRDLADRLVAGAEAALAAQVIMMRAATLLAVAMALAALASLWRRKLLWPASLVLAGLGLLFFLGGIL